MRIKRDACERSESDLPSDLHELRGWEIETVDCVDGVPIHKPEQHAPPSGETRRRLAPHHLITSPEVDRLIEIDRTAAIARAGKGGREVRNIDETKAHRYMPQALCDLLDIHAFRQRHAWILFEAHCQSRSEER